MVESPKMKIKKMGTEHLSDIGRKGRRNRPNAWPAQNPERTYRIEDSWP
jgi:hypothetical protein